MTNSNEPPCQIGDRIQYGGHFGTVKYIGLVEAKPSIWLGIDWDDPERGKHNGNLNGVQYFIARNPRSGSFIRPDKVNFGKTACASIESRYGQVEDEFTAKINQQKQLLIKQSINAPFVEMVGFDKIFNKQSNFSTLRIINLRDQNVSSIGPPLTLGKTCPNVEELDISKNLLSSWSDIFEICTQLSRLHWLNVSENLLAVPENYSKYNFPNLKTLICGSMELSWGDVIKTAHVFPNIEEFRAPYNKIESLSPTEGTFLKLRLLDLEGNKIEHWSEICKLGSLPTLEQLILENIALVSIKFEGDEPIVSLFESLKKLCIGDNLINEWESIGELNRFKNLENLKISKNPILDTEHKDTVHQIIIAKIEKLRILNGVEIESGERRGAEYDYIKKYGLEWLKVKGTNQETAFLKSHNRYVKLIEKYGEPEESELTVKTKMIGSSLIELSVVHEGFAIQKKLPPTLTVQKLVVLTQKLFSLSERPQLTYRSSADSHIEIPLINEMKEIGTYSMQDGDQIIVSK